MAVKKNYVNNKEFYDALVVYKAKKLKAIEENRPLPKIPDYIGLCILQIAKKLSTKGNFVNYSFREDMISDGIENSILYMDNFDPDKSKNPFAYFTRIIWNAFVLRIQKESKQMYIRYKSYENAVLMGANEDPDGDSSTAMNLTENMVEFIRNYEKKIKTKTDRKSVKKIGLDAFIPDSDEKD